VIGQGFGFDGVDDHFILSSPISLMGDEYTLTGWFKTGDTSGHTQVILSGLDESGLGSGIHVSVHQNKLRFSHRPVIDNNGGENIFYTPPSGDLRDGEWHHFAVVWQNPEMRMYYDGRLVATEISTANMPIPLYYIYGKLSPASTVRQFHGSMDDMRIYSCALTSDKVAALFNLDEFRPKVQAVLEPIVNGNKKAGGNGMYKYMLNVDCSLGMITSMDVNTVPLTNGTQVNFIKKPSKGKFSGGSDAWMFQNEEFYLHATTLTLTVTCENEGLSTTEVITR
jgi:hypothetical protein